MSLLPSSPYLPEQRLDVLERRRLERLEAVALVHLAHDAHDILSSTDFVGQKIPVVPRSLAGCYWYAARRHSPPDVAIRVHLNLGDLGVRQQPLHLARAAHHERPRRHVHAFDEQRPGGDDRLRPDVRSVQQDRAHADQALILDGAPVDDRAVPDRHVVAHGRRMRILHHVDDRAVLHVGAAADANAVHVAADDDRHPHTALFTDFDVADDLRAVVDVRVGWTRGSCPRKGRSTWGL